MFSDSLRFNDQCLFSTNDPRTQATLGNSRRHSAWLHWFVENTVEYVPPLYTVKKGEKNGK